MTKGSLMQTAHSPAPTAVGPPGGLIICGSSACPAGLLVPPSNKGGPILQEPIRKALLALLHVLEVCPLELVEGRELLHTASHVPDVLAFHFTHPVPEVIQLRGNRGASLPTRVLVPVVRKRPMRRSTAHASTRQVLHWPTRIRC